MHPANLAHHLPSLRFSAASNAIQPCEKNIMASPAVRFTQSLAKYINI
jgi:hypothetical protein